MFKEGGSDGRKKQGKKRESPPNKQKKPPFKIDRLLIDPRKQAVPPDDQNDSVLSDLNILQSRKVPGDEDPLKQPHNISVTIDPSRKKFGSNKLLVRRCKTKKVLADLSKEFEHEDIKQLEMEDNIKNQIRDQKILQYKNRVEEVKQLVEGVTNRI